jgi:hypothetical protein
MEIPNFESDIWRAQQYAGPKMKVALELYETEARARLLKTVGGMWQHNSLARKWACKWLGVTTADPASVPMAPNIFPSTHLKRRAVRIYRDALMEVWRHLPDQWSAPMKMFEVLARHAMADVTAGDKAPEQFFRFWLSEFNRSVTHYHQWRYGQHLQLQAKKAERASAARWGDRAVVDTIIQKLAEQRDTLGEFTPAKELWPEFFSALDGEGLVPQENGLRIVWADNAKGITLATFTSRISRIRNS